jgi:hypothetical protein
MSDVMVYGAIGVGAAVFGAGLAVALWLGARRTIAQAAGAGLVAALAAWLAVAVIVASASTVPAQPPRQPPAPTQVRP